MVIFFVKLWGLKKRQIEVDQFAIIKARVIEINLKLNDAYYWFYLILFQAKYISF